MKNNEEAGFQRWGPRDFLPGESVYVMADDGMTHCAGRILRTINSPLGWRYEVTTNAGAMVLRSAELEPWDSLKGQQQSLAVGEVARG